MKKYNNFSSRFWIHLATNKKNFILSYFVDAVGILIYKLFSFYYSAIQYRETHPHKIFKYKHLTIFKGYIFVFR